MDRARSLLDELLGPDRDRLVTDEWNETVYRDVCIYMLAGFCPYRSFYDAKCYIGRCPFKRHDRRFFNLYEKCNKPGLKEKEHALLYLLTEIYIDNYKDIWKKNYHFESFHESNDELLVRISILRAKKDEYIEEMEKNIVLNNLEEACSYYEKVEYVERAINCHLNTDIRICGCCGKIFDTSNQPPKYWDLHITSKYHLLFMDVEQKIGNLICKYRCENGGIIPDGVLRIVNKRAC